MFLYLILNFRWRSVAWSFGASCAPAFLAQPTKLAIHSGHGAVLASPHADLSIQDGLPATFQADLSVQDDLPATLQADLSVQDTLPATLQADLSVQEDPLATLQIDLSVQSDLLATLQADLSVQGPHSDRIRVRNS